MSIKMRIVAVVVGLLVVTGGWFFLSFKPSSAKLKEVKAEVETTKAEVAALEARLKVLQDLKAHDKELRAERARLGSALPLKPAVTEYIRQLQRVANESGLNFASIAPAQPSAPTGADATVPTLRSIGINVNAQGGFFEVEEFVSKLEGLERAMRIDTFSLGGSGDEGLSLQIRGQIFMTTPAPVAPAPAATSTSPQPSASPAAGG